MLTLYEELFLISIDDDKGTIFASKKVRKAAYWVNALGEKKLPKRVANGLVAKGVLRLEERRYLWVIPYEAYPQQDASAKYWVKQHLRAVILGGETPDPHTIGLLSLLKACSMLNLVFTRDKRRAAGKKVNELVKGELFGAAVAETLDEIEMAAAAAVMAATT